MTGHRRGVGALRALVRLYPPEDRARFETEIVATVEALWAERAAGRRAAQPLWMREALGLLGGAAAAHWHRALRRRVGLAAMGVFAAVLAAYAITLAPTVTFWDAGEFLAAAHSLGIPHPPGTPVFVFLANVWARLVPVSEFAFRVNLMTAVFGAASIALLSVVVLHALGAGDVRDRRMPAALGAACAALVAAFSFTVWQNANETEVYTLAAFAVASCTALAIAWRRHRGSPRAAAMLLLIAYVSSLAVGTHLMGLLAGPAVLAFMGLTMRERPLDRPAARRAEWATWIALAATWLALVATGLGNPGLLVGAGIALAGAVWWAVRAGAGRFAGAVVVVALVGVSTFLFLYLRAGVGPTVNMADPSTWGALADVIARTQYPPRTPLDDPLALSGPDNPGRTLSLLLLQVQNYLQYFDWQWAFGLAPERPAFAAVRLPITLLFTSLGVAGAAELHRRDRGACWMLLLVFLATGPGLVGYMNFKPGFSLAWDRFPGVAMHEVRERDYFFLISFQVWGLFAGVGIAALYRAARERLTRLARGPAGISPSLALPLLGLALVPLALNWRVADRSGGPTAELARDFGYDLLQTVEPYGIVITGGDNDTYPLWYAQVVEGVRRDVTVVVQTLANTDWYVEQLRDRPVAPFNPDEAPWFAALAPAAPPPPVLSWTDEDIAGLAPVRLARDLHVDLGVTRVRYPEGAVLWVSDIVTLRLIQENAGRRPVYFATTAAPEGWVRLSDSLVQEGLALRVYTDRLPDAIPLAPGIPDAGGAPSPPVDLARTGFLVRDVYRYAGLFETSEPVADPTHQRIALSLRNVFLQLANGHLTRGEREDSLRYLERAHHLFPSEWTAELIAELREGGNGP